MNLLYEIVVNSWEMLLSASGYILLGLVAAGLIHVLLPDSLVARFMGRGGLSGAALAALIGVPLPICSCGIVPLAMELRKKGASRQSTIAFLITTPESSVDSILLTWGLLGPIMAIARPVAAFFTAMLAAVLSIGSGRGGEANEAEQESCSGCCDSGCSDSPAGEPEGAPRSTSVFGTVVKPAVRYATTDLLDSIVFWLLLGILLAGIIGTFVPADLADRGLGSGIMPMILLIVAGVPLYLCASASTPVAVALFLKGVSPGAALVFLLTGPATNISTLLMLAKTFGRRFVGLYLASIVVAALACGLLLDALLVWTGWSITAILKHSPHATFRVLEIGFALLFLSLAGWRLWAGALSAGLRDLFGSFRELVGMIGFSSANR